ncbi:MAG: hypothetical protein JXR14_04340 [Paracoccaceae bacterium]
MSRKKTETRGDAFEERMKLRRWMLEVAGVRQPARRLPDAIEEQIKSTVINCLECPQGGRCRDWLETSKPGQDPPEFCKNLDTILRIRVLQDIEEDPA